jgi:cobalt-zinc-cadmium efflux system outer membrane protein
MISPPFLTYPLILIALSLLTTSAIAAEALVVSLKSIPDRISKQNPDLAAARLLIAEAQGRFVQSGRRSNPDLNIGVNHNGNFRERGISIGLSQKFPITNRLTLERAVTATALKGAKAEIRNVERQLIAEAQQILIKSLAIQRQKQLLKKQSAIAKQLADYISDAAQKGEGSVLDAGQARLEAAQFTNQLRQLDAESATLNGALKPLLGMSVNERLVISGSLPDLPPPSLQLDTNRRPDLQAAQFNIQQAAEAAALERARRYDDIELSFSGGYERSEDAPEGFNEEAVFSLGVTIPLPLWNKNEGAIQEADARKLRREKEVIALDKNIRHEAATAHAEMTEWAKLTREISTTLLPLAEKQADLATQAYREGLGDLQATLRTREQLLKLASSRLNALRDFHLAKVRYEAALGLHQSSK